MKRLYVLWALCLFAGSVQILWPMETLELGAGFGDMGASRDTMNWEFTDQGTRKDIPVTFGWRHTGDTRVFWEPSLRIQYNYSYSQSGGMNNLEGQLGLIGFGIHLADPFAAYADKDPTDKWFATMDFDLANLRVGGNLTPDSANGSGDQNVAFGPYSYFQIAIVWRVQSWYMVTEDTGVGWFFEVAPAIFEWGTDGTTSEGPAYGYAFLVGLNVMLNSRPNGTPVIPGL